MTESMDDLISALRSATGPDRMLDLRIAQAIAQPWAYVGEPPADIKCARFTASIDAALTLVPEGWFWRAGRTPLFQAWAGIHQTHPDHGEPGRNEFFWHREHWQTPTTTPAIALCITCLHAHASLQARVSTPTEEGRSDR